MSPLVSVVAVSVVAELEYVDEDDAVVGVEVDLLVVPVDFLEVVPVPEFVVVVALLVSVEVVLELAASFELSAAFELDSLAFFLDSLSAFFLEASFALLSDSDFFFAESDIDFDLAFESIELLDATVAVLVVGVPSLEWLTLLTTTLVALNANAIERIAKGVKNGGVRYAIKMAPPLK